MVVTRCSVMTGDDRHRAVIFAAVVPVIGPDVREFGVWVEVCPSDTDGCVPSRNDISLSGLVSPPPNVAGSFPVIVNV